MLLKSINYKKKVATRFLQSDVEPCVAAAAAAASFLSWRRNSLRSRRAFSEEPRQGRIWSAVGDP